MTKQVVKSKLWFIPVRIHSTKTTKIVEAETLEDGLKKLIADITQKLPKERNCSCKEALKDAIL